MSFCIFVFLLLAFFNGVLADGPLCPGPFNPPNNISTQVVYPVSNNPVTFPTDYNCVYQINVPQGWSSYVVVTAIPSSNTTNAPILQVIDFNQKVENFQYAGYEEFYFIASGGRIKLSTQSTNVTFQILVKWYSNIPPFNPSFVNVSASDSQPSIVGASYANCHVTAETRVSAITIPSVANFQGTDRIKNLRSVLIFDGSNENSTCLGSAYQLLNSNRQWVSTGKTLSIFQLQPHTDVSGSQLLIQDFEITKEIGEYQGIGGSWSWPVVIDASKQASAFSTYSHDGWSSDCLLNITGTGTLDVYNGGITQSKSNLIASYSESSNGVNLPQTIRGVVRTYVLTGGVATVQINSFNGCGLLTNNVEGFITSREYKTNLTLRYSKDSQWYLSNAPFNYTLNLKTVDLSQNKSLQMTISNNETNVLNVVYNSSNPPMLNTVLSGIGNDMKVIYLAHYDSKKDGFYIDFTATKVKESTAKSYRFIIIFAILWTGFF
ncbi:hypothetical protein B9Z55_000256 [Caenorhabditis nigoni]|uniref:Uncharacterized protein n=1 Tax=Caenorhabditis nigoni TaxID=1611254 RepID=A0A2G5VKX0_9PELO|nr:hypothetical protein B9Z55_000256 [Caenorhabditis nigoni]